MSDLGRFMLAVFVAFCLGLFGLGFVTGWVVMAQSGHAQNHDWYAGQSSKASRPLGFWSCCNGTKSGGDCKPVPATIDDDGRWVMIYDGHRFIVPPDAILPDEANGQPLEAHGCVRDYHGVPTVLCFWRRAAGG